MRKLAVISCVLVLAAASCQRQTGDTGELGTIKAGVLTVGSDIPFEPFEYEDDAGELTGFDVDLIKEIASRLELEVEWIDADFEGIFTSLAAGQFDAVASATTITEERSRQVNFTDPYFVSQQALSINSERTPDIDSVDDLGSGHTVAVQAGTTGRDWATENLGPKGVEIREFPDAPDTYNALEAGVVTGVIFDEPSAISEAVSRPALRVVEIIDTGERYGFAVDPEKQALLDAMNRVLREIIDDGTYDTIFAKYSDLPPGGDIRSAGD